MRHQTGDLIGQCRSIHLRYSVTAPHPATRIDLHIQQCWRLIVRDIELIGTQIQATPKVGLFIVPVCVSAPGYLRVRP
jgi:hypothetical protein